MYKIAYIDDQDDQIRNVQRKTEIDDIEVIEIELSPDINDVLAQLIKLNIEAVLIDFKLSETKPEIHYSGVDVANELDKLLFKFPSIVLTAHSEDAEINLEDVNKIYDRENYYANPKILNRRIKMMIESYKKGISAAEEKIVELKQKEILTLIEEEELLDSEDFLEKSIFKLAKIPKEIKRTSNLKRLDELIESANNLLKEVKKNG